VGSRLRKNDAKVQIHKNCEMLCFIPSFIGKARDSRSGTPVMEPETVNLAPRRHEAVVPNMRLNKNREVSDWLSSMIQCWALRIKFHSSYNRPQRDKKQE